MFNAWRSGNQYFVRMSEDFPDDIQLGPLRENFKNKNRHMEIFTFDLTHHYMRKIS